MKVLYSLVFLPFLLLVPKPLTQTWQEARCGASLKTELAVCPLARDLLLLWATFPGHGDKDAPRNYDSHYFFEHLLSTCQSLSLLILQTSCEVDVFYLHFAEMGLERGALRERGELQAGLRELGLESAHSNFQSSCPQPLWSAREKMGLGRRILWLGECLAVGGPTSLNKQVLFLCNKLRWAAGWWNWWAWGSARTYHCKVIR